MILLPALVIVILAVAAAQYAMRAAAAGPGDLATVKAVAQVHALVAYCNNVERTLEANPVQRASFSGQVTVGTFPGEPQQTDSFQNWASGPAGSVPYTIQCWIGQGFSGVSRSAITSAAAGNATVGIATSTTSWSSIDPAIPPQRLIRAVPGSVQGSPVIESGY